MSLPSVFGMHLPTLIDPIYALGALWGALTGTPITRAAPLCVERPSALFSIAREGAWSEAAWALRPAVPAGVTAVVDVAVIPMDTNRALPNQTVLIESGRITALGPASQVKVPAGATRIDGKGKFLMPGLADMHEHNPSSNFSEDRPFSFLANGVTTIRYIDDGTLRTKRMTGIPGPYPRIYVPVEFYGEGMPKLDSVAAHLARYKAEGYDFIKLLPMQSSKDSVLYDSLLATARRLGLPIATHAHGGPFEQTLALGGSSEHVAIPFGALGKDPTPEAFRTVATAVRRAGAWTTPTLDCLEGRNPPEYVKTARQIVKALQDAGAKLLLGADADFEFRQSPSMVHSELAALVRAGLTPYQALLTGTRNVAEYFRILDSAGTVAVGKRADLVLLYGDPLADIRHTREPAGVLIGGQWLDRTALDQRLLVPPPAMASRPLWLVLAVSSSITPSLTGTQEAKLRVSYKTLKYLTDSLERAKSLGQGGASTVLRIQQQLAEELGVMRAVLTPEQYASFDPIARVWLREQARQGSPMTVPGVAPTP